MSSLVLANDPLAVLDGHLRQTSSQRPRSQPTLSGVSNVASVSTVATVGSVSTVTLTFSEALPDANYSVHAQCPNYTIPTGYDNKTTNTVKISWNGNPGEVSVSGF